MIEKELKADDAEWRTYKIIRKMATGIAKNGEIIDLRNYSNGVDWKNTSICVGVSRIELNTKTNKIISSYNKIDDNTFQVIAYTDDFVLSSPIKEEWDIIEGTNRVYTYSGNVFHVASTYCLTSVGSAGASAYLKYTVKGSGGIIREWVVFNDGIGSKDYKTGYNQETLQYDEIVTLEIHAIADKHGGASSSISCSIEGGVYSSGEIRDGVGEWLAYES